MGTRDDFSHFARKTSKLSLPPPLSSRYNVATMPLVSGTKIGQYEIISPLGAGSMGEVYRARDSRLDRDVAIKVLPQIFSTESTRRLRFEIEARAAAALNHPNILSVFQMGTHEGVSYIVCELLEGKTLAETLRRGPLALRQAISSAFKSHMASPRLTKKGSSIAISSPTTSSSPRTDASKFLISA